MHLDFRGPLKLCDRKYVVHVFYLYPLYQACQVAKTDVTNFYDIGDADTPSYSVDSNSDIVITYTSGSR